ncbi:MAG: host attachment protein [Rubrivivax sp.]|nr:host attachment protein [Rubrivivax sp.]
MTGTDKTVKRQSALDWIVVANAARARVFERDDENQALREIADCVHTASRQPGAALTHDRPGQARKSQASTAFAPHTAPLEREHERFAREVAKLLEDAALSHRMPALVLLASNPFLGELKAQLGDAARKLLKGSAPVDLTLYQHADLEHRVTRALADVTLGA